MIYRIVRLEFDPHFVPDFLQVFSTRKSYVVGFEGCVSMKLLRDQENSSVFFTISLWESEEKLNQYRKSAIFMDMWATIKPWFHSKAEAWTTSLCYEGKNPHNGSFSRTD